MQLLFVTDQADRSHADVQIVAVVAGCLPAAHWTSGFVGARVIRYGMQ